MLTQQSVDRRHAMVVFEQRCGMMAQPNILFVITDQQRADHAGFMGNRVVRTPNLDRIATTGTVFELSLIHI